MITEKSDQCLLDVDHSVSGCDRENAIDDISRPTRKPVLAGPGYTYMPYHEKTTRSHLGSRVNKLTHYLLS